MLLFNFLALIPLSPIILGLGMLAVVVFSAQREKTMNSENAVPQTEAVAVSVLPDASTTQDFLLQDIVTLFEKKQIFLRPGLKVDDVARECMSNRTYVSNAINSYYGQSFTALVNSFRVNYAKQLIATYGPSKKLSEICTTSGFSDEVSFIRNFKKFTGVTPSEWSAANVASKYVS